ELRVEAPLQCIVLLEFADQSLRSIVAPVLRGDVDVACNGKPEVSLPGQDVGIGDDRCAQSFYGSAAEHLRCGRTIFAGGGLRDRTFKVRTGNGLRCIGTVERSGIQEQVRLRKVDRELRLGVNEAAQTLG